MQSKIVLFSGGLDSTVALVQALKTSSKCLALHFIYGSKHELHETEAAEKTCKSLKVEMRTVKLPIASWGFKSALLGDSDMTAKPAIVPFRNGVMLSIAAGIAESEGYDEVILSNHFSDEAYPDCREDFIEHMSEAVFLGTGKKVKLSSPFCRMKKSQIVALGKELGVDFSQTWSCYSGNAQPCGRCAACIERKKAFEEEKNEVQRT